MANPVPTTAMMSAPQGMGALFAPRVSPDAQRRKKIADGLAKQTAYNTRVAKSLQPKPADVAQPNPPAPADDDFMGPPAPGAGAPGLLPAPSPSPAVADSDPNAAMDQYSQNRLGSTEFRINRRHPAREQRAVGGPFAGQRASQAVSAVQNEFQGLGDDAKQGLVDQRQSMLFTPKSRPPASAPMAAGTPAPAAPAPPVTPPAASQPYQGFKNLAPPMAATGQPLGGATFSNLQKPRQPGSAMTAPRRATGPRTARLA